MTIGADGTHHVEIQRDFLCPPAIGAWVVGTCVLVNLPEAAIGGCARWEAKLGTRSEEHTSELQSLRHLVCRLLLEKKKKKKQNNKQYKKKEKTNSKTEEKTQVQK